MRQRLHILQHVEFEGPGTIEDWARANKLLVTRTNFFDKKSSLPAISDFDLLAIMGGPMSVSDEKQYPWLVKEKKFIQQAIEFDKKILGVCLGAQLVAAVMGAKVYSNKNKEIGWFEVAKTGDAKHVSIANSLPDSFDAFHWHGDTYDLPKQACQLFRSKASEQQGFIIGSNILGLQFHLEVGKREIVSMLNNSTDKTTSGPFVQSPVEIKNNFAQAELLRPFLFELMSSFALQAAKGDKNYGNRN